MSEKRRVGRPSKITDQVRSPDPATGQERLVPITEAICQMVEVGVYPSTAARAHGISAPTLANWCERGEHIAQLLADPEGPDIEDLTEEERLAFEFLNDITRAEARGLAWHEMNVRRVAKDGVGDGRLSLEFLARRERAVYGREPRTGAGLGAGASHEIEEGIDAELERLESQLGVKAAPAGDPAPPQLGTGD